MLKRTLLGKDMTMKKRLSLCLLLGSVMLPLSSCTVNWFDGQHDVPWWVVAIPLVILAVILLIVARYSFASKTYVCPQCDQSFTPRWWVVTFAVHVNSDRVLKCPHCGKRSFCSLLKKPEE